MQLFVHFPLLCLSALLLAGPALAAGTSSTRLLSVRGDDPQLSLRADRSGQPGGTDNLGMQLELPPDDVGRTRFDLATTSQDGGAPQFSSLALDQKLRVDRLQDMLPGKLDLGLHASRNRDASGWGVALMPKFRMERDRLALKADMSFGRLSGSDSGDLGARYKLSTSYALTQTLSFGVDGSGELQRNGNRPQAGFDQVMPQFNGRYLITEGIALRYRMGWDMNLANGERSPDVQLKFDLKF